MFPGTCVKRLLRLKKVKYHRAKQSLARAVNLSSKLHKKQLQLFPVKSWPLEPRVLQPLDATFCSSSGPELYCLCGVDNPWHLGVLPAELQLCFWFDSCLKGFVGCL